MLAAGKNIQFVGGEKYIKESSITFWHLAYYLIGKYVGFIPIVFKTLDNFLKIGLVGCWVLEFFVCFLGAVGKISLVWFSLV